MQPKLMVAPEGLQRDDARGRWNRQELSAEWLHALVRCRRIAIVGKQGAGKTTFAQTLAKVLGLEFVEVPWRRNITRSQIDAIRQDMARREGWVIDGDFELLEMAEAIIHLDFPLSLCLYRATRRGITNFLKWKFRNLDRLAAIPQRIVLHAKLVGEIFYYQYEPAKQPVTLSDKILVALKSPMELERLLAAIKGHCMDA